jgi:sugar phosphate isomerase/epimerase
LAAFRLPIDWQIDSPGYKAELERLASLAAIARQIGCRRAVTVIEPGSERVYHENFEFHRRRLAELGDMLAAHEIRLGIGFLAPAVCRGDRAYPFVRTAEEMLLLVRTIGSPNVGLALDTWHWHTGGGTVDQLRTLAPGKIVCVSLADGAPGLTAETASPADRRLPGEGGAVDNPAVLAALAKLGYDGPLAPAADKSRLAGRGRDQIVKAAASAFDQVWKSAGLNQAGRLAAVSGS